MHKFVVASLAGALGLTCALALPALASDRPSTLHNFAFNPATLTIGVGDSVTFSYDGKDGLPPLAVAPHNVHFVEGGVRLSGRPDGSPDTSAWTKSRTFTAPGTYHIYCEVHGTAAGTGMAGTIVVRAPANSGPAPTTSPTKPRKHKRKHHRPKHHKTRHKRHA
jgi:plastocyanin